VTALIAAMSNLTLREQIDDFAFALRPPCAP